MIEHKSWLLSSTSPQAYPGPKFLHKPSILHIREAISRFLERFGNQFAASITYFLILAVIPMLMFGFSVLGFILDVISPQFIDNMTRFIQRNAPQQENVVALLEGALDNWKTVGILGLGAAFYTAQGFIGNVKDAIRAQLRHSSENYTPEPIFFRILNNTLTLMGILIGTGLTIGLTAIGTGLRRWIVDWLALPHWFVPILTITPVLITLLMSWLIFLFIFTMIPATPITWRTKALGSVMGAVSLTAILNLAGVLVALFSKSPTAALFGPVIAIMLAMNVFARTILFVAAWMGTSDDQPIFAYVPSTPALTAPMPTTHIRKTPGALKTFFVATGLVTTTLLGVKHRGRTSTDQSHKTI